MAAENTGTEYMSVFGLQVVSGCELTALNFGVKLICEGLSPEDCYHYLSLSLQVNIHLALMSDLGHLIHFPTFEQCLEIAVIDPVDIWLMFCLSSLWH